MIKRTAILKLGPVGLFGGRDVFLRERAIGRISKGHNINQTSGRMPWVLTVNNRGRQSYYIVYKDISYSCSDTDAELDDKDIIAFINDHEMRRERKLEAVRTPASNTKKSREPISSEVQRAVWRRDNGRCVKCGSGDNIHYDHIIPVSKGGSNSARNIQVLCANCNMRKGAKIGG